MPESLRQNADDFEPVPFPETDRGCIGRDNQVVLHCPKAPGNCLALRMLAHFRSNACAAGVFCNNVAAVASMSPQSGLVWLDVIGAKDSAVFIRSNKGRGGQLYPNPVGLRFRDIRRKSIGRTCPEHRFDDMPGSSPVLFFKGPNFDQAKSSLSKTSAEWRV